MRLLNWILGPNVVFELMTQNARLPTQGSKHAVGFDLYTPRTFSLEAEQHRLIPLGIKSSFRNDWSALIWQRSGLGTRSVDVLGGVVDPDYRGEWKVILINHAKTPIHFIAGDRIAQAVFQPVYTGACRNGAVQCDTGRGDKGYGSTGN